MFVTGGKFKLSLPDSLFIHKMGMTKMLPRVLPGIKCQEECMGQPFLATPLLFPAGGSQKGQSPTQGLLRFSAG